MVSLHDAIKAHRKAAAWRWAGARLSRVGRPAPSGPRRSLGDAVRIDEDARRALGEERRPVGYPCMATLHQEQRRIESARPHWSEVPA